jgi:UDP-N-acetylglucosamine:LPS N-acetylglucosamine transferase
MTDVRSILLITSNGFGMGHLVRQLAIAAALPEGVRCTIMTLSQAAPVAVRGGAVLEYCPSYTTPWMSKRAWHRGYLRDRVVALAEEVDADVVAFDGVVPYAGLLAALRRLPVASVWVRRGVWRADASTAPLAFADIFDLIIEPGDLGERMDAGATHGRGDARKVGVVTQAGPQSLLDRDAAARVLGVDAEKPTVLFNVGSNAIAGLDEIMEGLASRDDINVVTTKDALGRNRSGAEGSRVHTVRGVFPLHPYLAAVDLAVTSVGYNAAHEFTACAVPTVLVPADNITDDQRARALAMQQQGVGVVVEASQPAALAEIVERLIDDEFARAAMASAARDLQTRWGDGAQQAAQLLLKAMPRAKADLIPLVRLRARLLVEWLLGFRDQRPAIDGVAFTRDLAGVDLDTGVAVEHIHPGTSADYADRRRVIAEAWYGRADGGA